MRREARRVVLEADLAVGVEALEVGDDLVARGLWREGEREGTEPGEAREGGVFHDVAGGGPADRERRPRARSGASAAGGSPRRDGRRHQLRNMMVVSAHASVRSEPSRRA